MAINKFFTSTKHICNYDAILGGRGSHIRSVSIAAAQAGELCDTHISFHTDRGVRGLSDERGANKQQYSCVWEVLTVTLRIK